MAEYHEIANVFPLLDEDELKQLAMDIVDSGLRRPVVMFEGKILDGRNRYRACQMAGVKPTTVEFGGDWDNALKYVTSENMVRRHLTASQRGMVAARLANLRKGRQPSSVEGAKTDAVSQVAAAEQMKVGRETVKRAKQVQDRGVPELVDAVDRNEIPLHSAVALAQLPETEQREVVAGGKAKVKEKVTELRSAPAKSPTLEQLATRRKKLTDDTLYDLAAVLQDVKAVVARLAEGEVTIALAEQEVINLAAAELQSLVDWLKTLAKGGITDASLNELLAE